jgi:predicted ribosome quality control (RQC) complex YloA/Tae2 family protein
LEYDGLTLSLSKRRILRYELPGGWTLLVGASDEDNEYVSTAVAEGEDWWFHAHSVPGSHVILRVKSGEEPSSETLRQAAAVAAYHSKARRAGTVPVYCTRVRNVKKPRGTKTGTVEVSEGKLMKVRPDNSFAVRVHAEPKVPGTDR